MSRNTEKAAAMLSLAQKAGRIAGGAFAAEKAIRGGDACLVILAADASDNTRKKYVNMAAWHHVPLQVFLDREELGRRIGKAERSVLAVTDPHFAEAIQKQLISE